MDEEVPDSLEIEQIRHLSVSMSGRFHMNKYLQRVKPTSLCEAGQMPLCMIHGGDGSGRLFLAAPALIALGPLRSQRELHNCATNPYLMTERVSSL